MKKAISLKIDEDLLEKIIAESKRMRLPLSTTIRWLLSEKIEEDEKKRLQESKK